VTDVMLIFEPWLRTLVVHQMEAILGAFAVALLIQSIVLARVLRRVSQLAGQEARVAHLTDGLALLTDTTEAGLTTLIREVERLGQRPGPVRAASRRTVATRVAAAAATGAAPAAIAGKEAMSESEVRLHLMLQNVTSRKAALTRASA
jgi:hypothetical protein